jgi:hypothetical protein
MRYPARGEMHDGCKRAEDELTAALRYGAFLAGKGAILQGPERAPGSAYS